MCISDCGPHRGTSYGLSTHEVHEWLPWPFVDIQHPRSKHKDCLYGKWDHEGEKNVLLLWTWFFCWKEGRRHELLMLCVLPARPVGKAHSSAPARSASSNSLLSDTDLVLFQVAENQVEAAPNGNILSLVFYVWGAALILSSFLSVWWGFTAWKLSNES